jgi:RNA polymerase sigma factor (sigma-70 family)
MPILQAIDRWLIDEVLPYEARFLAVARRLVRDQDEAADLVQEALVRLLALDGRAAITNPRAYIIRSIQNIAIERMRRAKVVAFKRLAEIDAYDLQDEAPDPFRIVSGLHQVERLAAVVEALPERNRMVFVRRCLREQPSREIAADLGISLSTFDKRLARAIYLVTRALDPGDRPAEPRQPDEDTENQVAG